MARQCLSLWLNGFALASVLLFCPAARAQFDLGEPGEESSAAAPSDQKPNTERQRAQSTRPAAVEFQGPRRPATDRASQAPAEARVSKPQDAVTLIESDPVPEPFFRGAIPRTPAIGEDATLLDVCHVGTHCWAVGTHGVICQSGDSGRTWRTRFLPLSCTLKSVCFLTDRIGWVAGVRIDSVSSAERAVLFRTRDGGQSWVDLSAPSAELDGSADLTVSQLPGICHIRYFGLEEAIAVTAPIADRRGQGIIRSEDGGQTWQLVPSEDSTGIWSAGAFLSTSEGIVVGRNQAYAAVVARQTVVINPPQTTLRQFRGVSIDTDGRGWIAGDNGTVFSTINAGITWQPHHDELPEHLADVADFSAVAHRGDVVILGGIPGSFVLRSDSAGENWKICPLDKTGHIHQLEFLSDSEVLAVGSFGQIHRSDDGGSTWTAVRSAKTRTAILNLVTNAEAPAWKLLASLTADDGLRSSVYQLSQPEAVPSQPTSRHSWNENSRSALMDLGICETTADWVFSRNVQSPAVTPAQLLSSWDRQTDGRVRELLPLRLAREIRTFRPSLIVIEPAMETDPVSSILQDAVEYSIRMAAEDVPESAGLALAGLQPWHIQRVVTGAGIDRQASLRFSDADLLPNLGTTIGLLSDAVRSRLKADFSDVYSSRTRTTYELQYDSGHRESLRLVTDGLEASFADARREIRKRSPDDISALQAVTSKSRTESSALQGHVTLTKSGESLIAELQSIGAGLPDNLVLHQLRELSSLNRNRENMEGFLAVEQEIVRRFPGSDDAARAAELLFLLYSSAELRHYRMGSMASMPLAPVRLPAPASSSQDSTAPNGLDADGILQPTIQPVTASAFSAAATNQLSALNEKWDQHATTALRILKSRYPGSGQLPPEIQLRIAANLRLGQRNSEYNSVAADLSHRQDRFGILARADFQASNPAPGVVNPVVNLPQQNDRPYLDGQLSESIWENAQELRLIEPQESTLEQEGTEVRAVSASGTPPALVMLAWDAEFLYFAARMEHMDHSPVQLASGRRHDAQHHSLDRVTLAVDTDRDFGSSFSLTVDESGQTSEQCWFLKNWNPEWYVAVDSDHVAWRVEAAIPLSALSSPPARPGTLWSFSIQREKPGRLRQQYSADERTTLTEGTGMVRFIRGKPARRK